MKKILCLLFSVIIVLSLTSCSKDDDSPENQIINYNINSEPVTLDPQIADDKAARIIIMNIFEGLCRLDQNDCAVPGAAESWSIDKTRTEYTFRLRKDALWSDGSPLTADDFVYGFERSLTKSTGSETASLLYCIKNAEAIHKGKKNISELGVKAVNDRTLMIQLEYENEDFLTLLTEPPAMPCKKEYFEKSGGQYGRDDDKILSNGAFIVKESGWEHNEYIKLRKNEHYVGKDVPIPAGVDITIGQQPQDMVQAISDGELDCGEISEKEIVSAKGNQFFISEFADTVWGISFNTMDEAFQNKDLRISMLASLDRNFILNDIPENSIKADCIIPDFLYIGGQSYRNISDNQRTYISFSDDAKKNFELALTASETEDVPKINIICDNDSETQNVVNNIIESWNTLTTGYVNKKPMSLSLLYERIESSDYVAAVVPLTVNGRNPVNLLELF